MNDRMAELQEEWTPEEWPPEDDAPVRSGGKGGERAVA